MMAASLIFTPKAVPVSSVHIGSLIIDLKYPYQDPHRPSPTPEEKKDYFVAPYKAFKQLQSSYKKEAVRAHLTQIVSASFGWDSDKSVELEALEGRQFELVQPLLWFESACGSDDTRRWFERVIKVRSDVFLIVGFRTLFDPRLKQTLASGTRFSADVNVPIDMIATAAGVPLITGGALDPGLGYDRERKVSNSLEVEMPGEMVYAIHYKKVRFSTFKRRSLETSFLDRKNLWIDLTAVRSKSPAPSTATPKSTTGESQQPAVDGETMVRSADLTDNLGVWGDVDGAEGKDEDKFLLPEDWTEMLE